MLVLSRKLNERIMIGDYITITIVEIRGDKVRLGIEAPTEVPVHREEVFRAIREAAKRNRDSEVGEMRNGVPVKNEDESASADSTTPPPTQHLP